MSSKSGKVVFIGNIPYDVTETQLTAIMSQVGTVKELRLVFDRETGKAKGFGFCTYLDTQTAQSAARNLNDFDINGRNLRVALAESDQATGGSSSSASRDIPPPFNPHDVPPGQDPVVAAVSSTPPAQLMELFSQLKLMSLTSPQDLITLLSKNPQLAYAIFQAMLLTNVVDAGVLSQVIQQQQQTQMQPPPIMHAPPMMQHQPLPPQQIQQAPIIQNAEEQQKMLLLQVLALTDEQIQALPPDQQENIRQLKLRVLGGQ